MKHHILLLALILTACGTEESDTSSVLEVHSQKDDIQVISAKSGVSISLQGPASSLVLGKENCAIVSPSDAGHTLYDCTERFEQLTGRPALHTLRVYDNGSGSSNSYFCSIMTVKTALLKSAYDAPSFVGVGFFSNQSNAVREISKSELVQVGTAKLKDGRDVLLHEFVGEVSCWRGTASSSSYATYTFKPFASYYEGNESYKVWENVTQNHSLGNGTSRFDRSSDLLQ